MPSRDFDTNQLVVSVIKTLRKEDDEIIGFCGIDVEMESLPSILANSHILSSDINFLIDAQGSYIFKGPHVDGTQTIHNMSITENLDPFHTYSDEILNTRKGFIKIKYNSQQKYMGFAPIHNTGWVLITLIDTSAVDKSSQPILASLILLQVMSLIVVSIGISITLKLRLKPLSALSDLALSISEGNYTHPLNWPYHDMQDELGQMSRAFESILISFQSEQLNLEKKLNHMRLELAAQYNQLLEAEKMASLGSLVAGVSHDINTPLGVGISVTSFLEATIRDLNTKMSAGTLTRSEFERTITEMTDSILMLEQNLTRAAELIKSFKQVAVDQSQNEKVQFNLKDAIDVVVMSLQHAYKERQVQVSVECPEYILMDSYPGAFSQILSNFIMNSVHHGFSDRLNGRINIRCEVNKTHLNIYYRDNGRGIDSQHLNHIFEPFYTTNRESGNTGLGMHIVKTLVTERLKGTIECESKADSGVLFTIAIPLLGDN